jgi:hypothetical protein
MQKQIRSSAAGTTPQREWDLEELMERLGGDQDFLRELLVIFRQDVRVNLQKSQAAIAIRDYDGLSRSSRRKRTSWRPKPVVRPKILPAV